MKFENTQVMNFEGAFRGLRNPLESWNKSDSFFGLVDLEQKNAQLTTVARKWADYMSDQPYNEIVEHYEQWLILNGILKSSKHWIASYNGTMADQEVADVAFIGPADMKLAQSLIGASSADRKFLRQIFVSVDITAPLFWFKEADTYKVGTVANSTSTMHKLASTPITADCFELDDYENIQINGASHTMQDDVDYLIAFLEDLRQKYNETKDKKYWKELVRWLPESWLQTRTWTCNYENLFAIVRQRENHKLTEWHTFIKWVETLPYSKQLIFNKSEFH